MTWDSTKNSSLLLPPSFIHAVNPSTSFVRYPFRMPPTSCSPSVSFRVFFMLLALKSFTLCVPCHLIAQLTYRLHRCVRLYIVEEWSNICKDVPPRLVCSSLSLVQKPIPIFTELQDGTQLLKIWPECGRGLVRGARSVCAFVGICWGKARKYSIWILDLKDAIWAVKGKAVPLQAWAGPEGSRKLRLPDFVTTAQDGGKVVSLTHRPPLPPGNTPGTHFC